MDFRCASGQQCVAQTPDGPALVHRPTLCHKCVAQVQAQYSELPNILLAIPLFKGGLRGQSGEAKVSVSKDAPAPLNVAVVDLEDSLQAILHRIGDLRIVDLVNQDDGVDWCLHVRRVYAQADRLIGISRHWSRRHLPCDRCSLRSLGSFSGDDFITCSACGAQTPLSDYAKRCLGNS